MPILRTLAGAIPHARESGTDGGGSADLRRWPAKFAEETPVVVDGWLAWWSGRRDRT
jgi:hypothetical protein